MPAKVLCCISLPPATVTSVPIRNVAIENKKMADQVSFEYYECCGKSICRGCMYSFCKSGNFEKCPFCKTEREGKTNKEAIEQIMKRVEAKDAGAMFILGTFYFHGKRGLQQDLAKGVELWTQAANLGFSQAHYDLGVFCEKGGHSKKMMSHYEAAAMAGHELARYNLGVMAEHSGNIERAIKHWTIAASAGSYDAMSALLDYLKEGAVSRELIDSTLTAYNNSCVEMRSEARDAAIRFFMGNNCLPSLTTQIANSSHH
jgi:TPR repeat protein